MKEQYFFKNVPKTDRFLYKFEILNPFLETYYSVKLGLEPSGPSLTFIPFPVLQSNVLNYIGWIVMEWCWTCLIFQIKLLLSQQIAWQVCLTENCIWIYYITTFSLRSFKILTVCLEKDQKLMQDLIGAGRELKTVWTHCPGRYSIPVVLQGLLSH